MRRRDLLIGAGSLLSTAALPTISAAGEARRVFKIFRGGSDIGRHTLSARQSGTGFEIDITIDIRVKLLGITAYRYELENREVWRAGQLVSMSSKTYDDGKDDFASVVRNGDVVEIDGSRFAGQQPGTAVSTSYYAREFIDRRPWISSQSGQPLSIAANLAGDSAETWAISGELETTLTYDDRGEWVDCSFDAGGEPGRYELVEESGSIAALWRAA